MIFCSKEGLKNEDGVPYLECKGYSIERNDKVLCFEDGSVVIYETLDEAIDDMNYGESVLFNGADLVYTATNGYWNFMNE